VRRPRCHTLALPRSHYVELARWRLQLGGCAFVEYAYSPVQHVLPTLSVRAGGKAKHIASSSHMTPVQTAPADEAREVPAGCDELDPLDSKAGSKAKKDRGGETSVPLLVCPDGRVLADSWAIAAHGGLAPIAEPSVQDLYDRQLGPLTRQWFYYYALRPQHRAIWDALLTDGQHWLWRLAYWALLSARIHAVMVSTFGAGHALAHAKCEAELRACLERIAETRLRGRTGKYLGGDVLSVEDVALASLVAPAVNPPLYCDGQFGRLFAALEAGDEEMRRGLEEWRATEAGRYCLELYATRRSGATRAQSASQAATLAAS
jgi:glutathione S-transferase